MPYSRLRPRHLGRATGPGAARLAVEAGAHLRTCRAQRSDVTLGRGANLHVTGKGRKQRQVPSLRGRRLLRAWLAETGGDSAGPAAPDNTGQPYEPRRDRTPRPRSTSSERPRTALRCSESQSPPTRSGILRHRLRAKGVPIEVIALILGHEDIATTYAFYLHAEMQRKASKPSRSVASPKTQARGYRAPDPS